MAATCPLCKAAASEIRYKRAFGGAVVSTHPVAPVIEHGDDGDDGGGIAGAHDDQRACGGCGATTSQSFGPVSHMGFSLFGRTISHMGL